MKKTPGETSWWLSPYYRTYPGGEGLEGGTKGGGTNVSLDGVTSVDYHHFSRLTRTEPVFCPDTMPRGDLQTHILPEGGLPMRPSATLFNH